MVHGSGCFSMFLHRDPKYIVPQHTEFCILRSNLRGFATLSSVIILKNTLNKVESFTFPKWGGSHFGMALIRKTPASLKLIQEWSCAAIIVDISAGQTRYNLLTGEITVSLSLLLKLM